MLTFVICSPTILGVPDPPKNAILVAASLICAVGLAREEIRNSPKVVATISESIWLAEKIWQYIAEGNGIMADLTIERLSRFTFGRGFMSACGKARRVLRNYSGVTLLCMSVAELGRRAFCLNSPFVANYDIPSFISDPVRGIIWELIIQGIVVPGVGLGGGSGDPGLPFFQITEWGKRCLAAGEFVPYDTGQFIDRLKARVPAVDQVVLLYLTEALQCFRAGTCLGSAVMVGVASERILLALRSAIESALDGLPDHGARIAMLGMLRRQSQRAQRQ